RAYRMHTHDRPARRPGPEVEGRLLSVHRDDGDPGQVDAQLFGGDLRDRGLLASPRVGATEPDPHGAVRPHVDACLGAIRLLVGAGAAHGHGDGHAHAAAGPGPRALLAPPDGVPHRLKAFDQVRGVEAPPRARYVTRLVRVEDPEVDRI